MARAKKVTAEVLERVPALIEQGLVAAQIAGAIGCTLGTLRVRCSQAGVSLRRKNGNKPKIAVRNRVGGLPGPISTGALDEISANGPGAKSTMRSCLPHAARISSGLPNRPAPIALLLQQTTVDQLRQRAARKGVSAFLGDDWSIDRVVGIDDRGNRMDAGEGGDAGTKPCASPDRRLCSPACAARWDDDAVALAADHGRRSRRPPRLGRDVIR